MIAVIGAGPAGLAVAWQLARAGRDVTVLEAGEQIGGLAASHVVSGVRVDLGQQRIDPSTSPDVVAALGELVELQVRPRRERIRTGGRWLPFPLTRAGLVRGLPPAAVGRSAFDAVTAAVRRARADTFAEVVRAELGPTVGHRFHEPHAWKLWGTDPRRLAGELARRHVLPSSSPGGARRGLGGLRARPTFLYPARGFGAIAEAMAAQIPEVRLRTKVTGLIEHPDRVTLGLADGRIVTASHVFSTLPATRTAGWLGLLDTPAPPVRALVLVYLTLEGRPYTDFDAHHLPERQVLPTIVSEPTNHRTNALDPRDRTVLCAEIPCWEGDAVWSAGPDELGRRVADDLVRSGLPVPRVVTTDVVRLPSVYPVMTPDALDVTDRAERALEQSRRVTALDRPRVCVADDTGRAIEMGFAAARCVGPDDAFDHDGWRRVRPSFLGVAAED